MATSTPQIQPQDNVEGGRLLSEATRPPEIKDLRCVEASLVAWEEKLKVLKLQFGEELSNWMRVVVLTDMLPGNVQDYIYTHVDKGTTFGALREKLRAVVSNKLAQMGGALPWTLGPPAGMRRGGGKRKSNQGRWYGYHLTPFVPDAKGWAIAPATVRPHLPLRTVDPPPRVTRRKGRLKAQVAERAVGRKGRARGIYGRLLELQQKGP